VKRYLILGTLWVLFWGGLAVVVVLVARQI